VSAEVGSTEGEDGRVHGGLEEEDGNQNTDRGGTGTSAAVGSKGNGTARVDDHDELGAEEDGETGSDETTNSEGDESVAKHVAGGSSRDTTVLMSVVDEEGGNGDLGTDVAELGTEGEPHVPLLPDGSLGSVSSLILDDSLGDLRKLGKEEENTNSSTSTGDSEVDKLDVGKAVLVLAGEEELGGNQGTDERGNTVPRLAELKTSVGTGGVANDDCVRVGRCLKSSETTSDDKGASAEAAKDCTTVGVGVSRLGNGPKQDSAKRVKRKTHQDGLLVASSLKDLSSNGREEEVTTTKVHDLETSGLETADAENGLEMLVEDIEKTVGETPEEEERDDESEGEDKGATFQVAACQLRGSRGDSTASHCDEKN